MGVGLPPRRGLTTESSMLKHLMIATCTAAALSAAMVAPSLAQNTVRTEAASHPRIATAIRELEESIRYMEAASHNFGGHKAKAIADARAAVTQLKLALAYRAVQDNKKK